MPAKLRIKSVNKERIAAGKSPTPAGCFLEGPAFDRKGNLHVVDLAFGRIFRISPKGEFSVFVEYDGEPNGLAIHKDGRVFVADHRHGIIAFDAKGKMTRIVSRYHAQAFKGVNDLYFDHAGNLYFTDQGVTDLADPTGCVYMLSPTVSSISWPAACRAPTGWYWTKQARRLYVAATRANAVWRMPFAGDGLVVRMGVQIQLSGGRGPDGMAMDEADGLAVAHPDMGAVWLFNRRGEPMYRVQSCRSDVLTNCAYQGSTLYITDSESGCVLRAEVPTAGRVLYSHT